MPVTAIDTESWSWKEKICKEAEAGLERAASLPPHQATSSWAAVDKILARLGQRYPSCALPSEFGLFISKDAVLGHLLQRELWMIISGYTVDPVDSVALGLERAVTARAYCLIAGSGRIEDTATLCVALSKLDDGPTKTIEDAVLRLFHTQSYERATLLIQEILRQMDSEIVVPWVHDSLISILTLCVEFRGPCEYDDLVALQYKRKRIEYDPSRDYYHLLGYSIMTGLSGDIQKAAIDTSLLDRRMQSWTGWSKICERLWPFVDELRSYASTHPIDFRSGLASVHEKAVARTKNAPRTFPSNFPRSITPELYARTADGTFIHSKC